MKRPVQIAFALLFCLPVFFLIPRHSHAQVEDNTVQIQSTPEEDDAIEETQNGLIEISTPSADVDEDEDEVNYTLTYPGLLPDHPLYFLKSFRDTVISMLISDPVKKAEFSLLRADKQMASASMLAIDNKQDYVQKALQDAEGFLTETVAEIKNARKQQKDFPTILDKTRTAVRKHMQTTQDLSPHLEGEAAAQADSYQNFLTTTLQELESIN